MSALALGFTACDEYEEAIPQNNPQAPVMSVDGVEVASGSELTAPINLNTFEGDSLELLKTVKSPELNEGTTIVYNVEVASAADFSDKLLVATTESKVAKTDLDNAFRTLFGKTPNARTVHFRFAPYFSDGTTRVKIGGANAYLNITEQSVTPVDLGIFVDEAYYIVTDALFRPGWDETLIKLEHSDADVYDDAVFSLTTVLQKDAKVQFLGAKDLEAAKNDPENAYLYAWGPGEENGKLYQGEDAFPYTINATGQYKVRIDMLERTYMIQAYTPILYVVGEFNGWNEKIGTSYVCEEEANVLTGFVDMTFEGENKFKFTAQLDWEPVQYGAGAEAGTLADHGNDITLEETGIMYFKLDLNEMTYVATKINSFGVIGNATPGGWDSETALTYNGGLVWEGTVALTAGELKFRANNAWDVSVGGNLEDLGTLNAPNCTISDAGTYKITLDLSDANQLKATLVKQ